MAKSKTFQDAHGNESSSRKIAWIIIINALLMVWSCIVFGFKHPDSFSTSLAAGGTLFGILAVPTFAYLFGNKYNERKMNISTKDNKDANNSDT